MLYTVYATAVRKNDSYGPRINGKGICKKKISILVIHDFVVIHFCF